MAEYYNAKPFKIFFTSENGGRMALNPVVPGKKPETVSGDYYLPLVERGLLAEWTDEKVEYYRGVYLKSIGYKTAAPKKKEVAEEPVKEVVEEAPVEVAEPVEESAEAEEDGTLTREDLEGHTVRELRRMIEEHDLGDVPADAKKSEIIDFILEKV